MTDDEPVTLFEALDSQEAHFLCQLLADEGIEARIESEAIDFLRGQVPFQHATCAVLVHKRNVEKAQVVAADYVEKVRDRSRGESATGPQYCYHCGELVESNPAKCPNCGEALEWSNDFN